MSRKIIPLLLDHRKKTSKKGGIINLSSYAGCNILPYGAVYSACKAFDDNFSRSISA
jgi:short-subunit dehydrogenase